MLCWPSGWQKQGMGSYSLLQEICSKPEPSRFQRQVKTERGAILEVAEVEEAEVPPVTDMEQNPSLNMKGAWSKKEDNVVLHHVANFGGTQWNKIQVGTYSCFLKLSMGQIKNLQALVEIICIWKLYICQVQRVCFTRRVNLILVHKRNHWRNRASFYHSFYMHWF
jgi:hypothetical protein